MCSMLDYAHKSVDEILTTGKKTLMFTQGDFSLLRNQYFFCHSVFSRRMGTIFDARIFNLGLGV